MITNLDSLIDLERYAEDKKFQNKFIKIKKANKERLAKIILDAVRVEVGCNSIFDVQIKKLHEYKRQLLNVMHIIYQYLSLVEDKKELTVAKTYIFAGKAAPGYLALR